MEFFLFNKICTVKNVHGKFPGSQDATVKNRVAVFLREISWQSGCQECPFFFTVHVKLQGTVVNWNWECKKKKKKPTGQLGINFNEFHIRT